ncbi:MAG: hypothetical protein JWN50_98 [Parcubacteria group bacterium]|nr:hypothetical protein [Parcubacteria group bacterium]
MDNKQKGAVSGIALTLILIVIVAITGIGYWWYQSADVTDSTVATTATSTTSYTYVIGSSTPAVPNTGSTVVKTITTYKRVAVAAAASGISGTTYHNGTYGLTIGLPSSFAGFRTYVTAGGPNGLPGTAEIHFVAPGESTDAFVVNVFSKAQWNIIRTNENYAHLNTSNTGEGNYLGENFTWIYSDTIFSHQAEAQSALAGAVFY